MSDPRNKRFYPCEDRQFDADFEKLDEQEQRIGIWSMTTASAIKDVYGQPLMSGCRYHVSNNGETFYCEVYYDEAGDMVCRSASDNKVRNVLCYPNAIWRRS